ncbi:MAG: PAS domain S-box protein [Deltaproteobacteria bacterium]|jgi:PAS domain S-box-containing protein|nr:PAS domain S-box protein [Deltaproteobacteria bacterium]
MDKHIEITDAQLREKELLSQAFKAFDTSIKKLRGYQAKLEERVGALTTELHHKNQELTNVLQSLSNGLVVTDLTGHIRTFNRAAISITGIPEEQALQKNINDLMNFEVLPTPIEDENSIEKISEGYQQEFKYKKNIDSQAIISSSTTLMESDEKEKQGIIINLSDITALKKLEEEAERRNRLTAMGEIAMQVAHEIRNPLGSIKLFVSMMKKDFDEDSAEMELMQHISSAIQSMNHIISNLLEYTKPKPIALDRIDVNSILSEFVEFSRFFAEQQEIEINLKIEPGDALTNGNAQLINQVFHNLFINACQSMPEGGNLNIEILKQVEADPLVLERLKNYFATEKKSINAIKIIFRDSGKGMSEDVRKKIFDPFFTTREQGTGLGMSIAHKTMASHKGTILIESEQNKGTQVTLIFPRLTEGY